MNDVPPPCRDIAANPDLSKAQNGNISRGWRYWWDYCAANGLKPFPARAKDVVSFVHDMSARYLPGTVAGYVSAISVVHKERDFDGPLGSLAVQRAKRKAYRDGPPSKQAGAMTADIRDAMIAACVGDGLAELRDRAMIATAYDCMTRLGELTEIDIDDIERAPGDAGGTIFLGNLKTDDAERKGRYAYVSAVTFDHIEAWIAAAGLTSGPLFRSTHHNQIGKGLMARKSIALALRHRAAQAGLAAAVVARISGHSGRIGLAQDMAALGEDAQAIKLAAGWKTDQMVIRYTSKTAAIRNGSARVAKIQGRAGGDNLPKIRIAALEQLDLLTQSRIIAALALVARVSSFENPR